MVACLLAIVLPAIRVASPDESRETVPLAGLSSIGQVVVTAASDTLEEAAVRRAAETRLARAGIALEGSAGPALLIDISADRNTTEPGNAKCSFGVFTVSLALRERVTTLRAPEQAFVVTTWETRGRVSRFSTVAPRQALDDQVQKVLSAFLAAVGAAQSK